MGEGGFGEISEEAEADEGTSKSGPANEKLHEDASDEGSKSSA